MRFKKIADPKDKFLKIRLTAEDRVMIDEKASAAALSTSAFVLKAALSRQTISKSDSLIINQLRVLTDALSTFYLTGTPQRDERLRPLLDACLSKVAEISPRPRKSRFNVR